MPRLKPNEEKWFYNFQNLLHDKFEVSQTNMKADIGRVRVIDMYESETGRLVPLDEPLNPKKKYLPKVRPAFSKVPFTEDMDGNQRYEAQGDFYVAPSKRGPHDPYEMHSDLSVDTLHDIYEHARCGRLYVNGVGTLLEAADDEKAAYVMVGKDGSAVATSFVLSDVKKVGMENLEKFYDKHPDLLDVPLGNEKLREQVFFEVGAASNIPNAKYFMEDMSFVSGWISGSGMTMEAFSEKLYDNYCWEQLHKGEIGNLPPKDQWCTMNQAFPRKLNSLHLTFQPNDPTSMERFFVYSPEKRAMLPFTEAFPSGSEEEAQKNAFQQLKAGNLYALGEREGKTTLVQFEKDDYEVDATRVNEPEPERPGFFKRMFHGMNKNWFKAEFEHYEEKHARWAAENTAAETLPAELDQKLAQRKAAEAPEQKVPEQEKAKTYTKEQFVDRLAAGILNVQRNATGRTLLASKNLTPEDVKQSPSFQTFLETPAMKEATERAVAGKHVSMTEMGKEYQNFVTQKQKAPDMDKAPVAAKVAEQNQPQMNVMGS